MSRPFGLLLSEVFIRQQAEGLFGKGLGRKPVFLLLGAWVDVIKQPPLGCIPFLTGLGNHNQWIEAERKNLLFPLVAVFHLPQFRAGRLDREIKSTAIAQLERSISWFGLPDRKTINGAFFAMAIYAGLSCPIMDVAQMSGIVLAADLALGRDNYAMNYIKSYRNRSSK